MESEEDNLSSCLFLIKHDPVNQGNISVNLGFLSFLSFYSANRWFRVTRLSLSHLVNPVGIIFSLCIFFYLFYSLCIRLFIINLLFCECYNYCTDLNFTILTHEEKSLRSLDAAFHYIKICKIVILIIKLIYSLYNLAFDVQKGEITSLYYHW